MLISRSCHNSIRYLCHELGPGGGSYLSYSKTLTLKTAILFIFSQILDRISDQMISLEALQVQTDSQVRLLGPFCKEDPIKPEDLSEDVIHMVQWLLLHRPPMHCETFLIYDELLLIGSLAIGCR